MSGLNRVAIELLGVVVSMVTTEIVETASTDLAERGTWHAPADVESWLAGIEVGIPSADATPARAGFLEAVHEAPREVEPDPISLIQSSELEGWLHAMQDTLDGSSPAERARAARVWLDRMDIEAPRFESPTHDAPPERGWDAPRDDVDRSASGTVPVQGLSQLDERLERANQLLTDLEERLERRESLAARARRLNASQPVAA